MTPIVALVLAATAARVEQVAMVELASRPALRLAVSGQATDVALKKGPGLVRVMVQGATLGPRFGRRSRVVWNASDPTTPRWLSGRSTWLRRLELRGTAGSLVVDLQVQSSSTATLQRDGDGILIVLDTGTTDPKATPPGAPAAKAGSDTAALMARLFPPGDPGAGPTETKTKESIADLYPRLFPSAPPEPAERTAVPHEPRGNLGPLHLAADASARYASADTFLGSPAEKTRDQYLELTPRLLLEAPLGSSRLSAEYNPAFRAFAEHDQINRDTHALTASLSAPLGGRLGLRASDHYVTGTLDTRLVDPGGEYFFGLGRFRRNEARGGASLQVGPRTSLELSGSFASLSFLERSSFFSYDSWSASFGAGVELTPNLKALAAYDYETMPRPRARPQAEFRAHSARVALTGEILPLLTGEVNLGFRSQRNPNAAEGGRSYTGVTFGARLSKKLTPEADLALHLQRATPPSAHGSDGFYVSTATQAVLQMPLALGWQVQLGLGRQWNDYRTTAIEIGRPRQDRILAWSAGLRRPLLDKLSLSASFRAEDRRSNASGFAVRSSGLLVQVDWEALARRAP